MLVTFAQTRGKLFAAAAGKHGLWTLPKPCYEWEVIDIPLGEQQAGIFMLYDHSALGEHWR